MAVMVALPCVPHLYDLHGNWLPGLGRASEAYAILLPEDTYVSQNTLFATLIQNARPQRQSSASRVASAGRGDRDAAPRNREDVSGKRLPQTCKTMLCRTQELLFFVFCPVFDFVKRFFGGTPGGRKLFWTPKHGRSARQTRKT